MYLRIFYVIDNNNIVPTGEMEEKKTRYYVTRKLMVTLETIIIDQSIFNILLFTNDALSTCTDNRPRTQMWVLSSHRVLSCLFPPNHVYVALDWERLITCSVIVLSSTFTQLKRALIRHCYVNRSSILHKSITHSTFTHHRCCYYYFNWTKNDLTNGLSIHPSFTIHSIADRNLGREKPNYDDDDRWWLRVGTGRQVLCPLCVFGWEPGKAYY